MTAKGARNMTPNIQKLEAIYDKIVALETDRIKDSQSKEEVLSTGGEVWVQERWFTFDDLSGNECLIDVVKAVPQLDWESDYANVLRSWHCGSGACFAGWTALEEGLLPIIRFGSADRDLYDPETKTIVTPRVAALKILGISDAQGYLLFRGDNTIDDIRTVLDLIIQGASDVFLNKVDEELNCGDSHTLRDAVPAAIDRIRSGKEL